MRQDAKTASGNTLGYCSGWGGGPRTKVQRPRSKCDSCWPMTLVVGLWTLVASSSSPSAFATCTSRCIACAILRLCAVLCILSFASVAARFGEGRTTFSLDDAKVELAAIDIDAGHAHADAVAQPKACCRAMAGQAVLSAGRSGSSRRASDVTWISPSAGSSMPWANRPNSSTPVTTASISSPIRSLEVVQQLDLGQLALGGLGPLLAVGAMLAQHDQLGEVVARLSLAGQQASSSRWIVRSG